MNDKEDVFPPIKETKEKTVTPQTLWMPIGLAMGTSLGVVFDQLAIGLAIGLSIGVALDQIQANQQSTQCND